MLSDTKEGASFDVLQKGDDNRGAFRELVSWEECPLKQRFLLKVEIWAQRKNEEGVVLLRKVEETNTVKKELIRTR